MSKKFLRFPGGVHKAVTLSYDDGIVSDLKLLEIINKKGIKCTFNINTGQLGSGKPWKHYRDRFSREETIEIYSGSGHEVAVHTLTHPFLEQLTPAEIAHEVLSDRENLEQMFKTVVRGMAYPFGTYSDDVVSVLKSCGIAYARTVESKHSFGIETDWLRLKPTCHHNDPMLDKLCDEFLAPQPDYKTLPRVFYLWGHSYEFDDRDNWEVLEKFCDKMGGRSDVWYATNIEIYDYVQAYNSLLFSADGTVCTNLSSYDVYFEKAMKLYCVKSGETLTID